MQMVHVHHLQNNHVHDVHESHQWRMDENVHRIVQIHHVHVAMKKECLHVMMEIGMEEIH